MRTNRISNKSRSDLVVNQLANMIVKGKFAVDDLLPSERELSVSFGVSRNSIREAIKILEARGLVAVRHGRGTVVTSKMSTPVSQAVSDSLSGQTDSEEKLLEARLVLEVYAARTAAVRATPADLKSLSENIEKFRQANTDIDRCAELDLQYHQLIVKAMHNEIFTLMLKSILTLLLQSRKLALHRSGTAMALEHHTAILDALRKKEPALAARRMTEHLENALKRLKGAE